MSSDQKPKHRWYQFSLKTLLAVVVISCVTMGLVGVPVFRARRQAAAVAALKKLRCVIAYDYQRRTRASATGPAVPPGPAWLRRWIGDDYFTNVIRIDVYDPKAGDAELDALRNLPRLEELDLYGAKTGNQGLKYLVELKGLRELRLEGTAVTDDALASIEPLSNLSLLALGETRVSDTGLSRLKKLTELTTLSLAGTQITDEGVEHLENMTKLQWLGLARTRVTGRTLAHLVQMTRLRQLDFSGTDVADEGLEHLASLAELEYLDLTRTRVSGSGLAHLAGLQKLTELRLSGPTMTDAGLRELQAGASLKTLLLNCPNLTDGGLENLGALAGLEHLSLSKTQVTDAGLEQLTSLTQLKHLNLSGTLVTDAGIDALNTNPALVTVDLQGTKVTEAGLARLKARGAIGGPLPNVTRILVRLAEPTELDFKNQPLSDVFEYLKVKHDIEIHVDRRRSPLPAATVTMKRGGISLAEALAEVLEPAGLDYDLRYEVLFVSAKPMFPRPRLYESAEGMAISPAIETALAARTELDFINEPLSKVLAYLQGKHGVEFRIDERAFQDAGRASDVGVTLNLKGTSLRSLLELMFDELDMTCVLEDETLVVRPGAGRRAGYMPE